MEQVIGGVTRLRQLHVSESAVVYSGHDGGLGVDVAVKVLSNDAPDFVTRVDFEVQRLKELSHHSGLVTLHRSGTTASGRPYVISELCDGSIGSALQGGFRFEPDDACLLLAAVADAVETLHEAGVSHQQIRPSNLLLKDGSVLVSDIGTIGAVTAGQTVSVRQSAGYVSPETFEESKPGPSADVYSLGATLFHLVSGTVPFAPNDEDPQLLSMLYRIATASVPDLRIKRVPDAVCLVIESAMKKMPTDRPSISELRSMLRAAAGDPGQSGTSEWRAGDELIQAVGTSADAESTSADMTVELDADDTDELDRSSISSETSAESRRPKQQAVVADPFLSSEDLSDDSENVDSLKEIESGDEVGASDGVSVDRSSIDSPSSERGVEEAELETSQPPPPAALIPPTTTEPGQSKTSASPSPPSTAAEGAETTPTGDQSPVGAALASAPDVTLPNASPTASVNLRPIDVDSGSARPDLESNPPPPTAESLIQLGNPPQGVSGSAAQVFSDVRSALSEAVATVRIKSSQYIEETKAKRASAKQPPPPVASSVLLSAASRTSGPEVQAQPLSFSTDQPPVVPIQSPKESTGVSSAPTQPAISTDVSIDEATKVSEEKQNAPIRTVVDEPLPSPVEGETVPVEASEAVPSVAEPEVTSDSTRILPPSDLVDKANKDNFAITSNRIPLLDDGPSTLVDNEETRGGLRVLKPPTKQTTPGGEGGIGRSVANVKSGARAKINDAVRKLQGQDGYHPASSGDERFSRNTLLLAGAAIVLFLAFSLAVAVSFSGKDDQELLAGDPANPSTVTTSPNSDPSFLPSDDSENSGSSGDNNDGDVTSSSIAAKSQDERVVLTSQVGRDQQLAVQSLNVKGVETEVIEEPSVEIDSGKVIRTEPGEGVELAAGQVVKLYVSTGPPGTIVRNVTGRPQADAVAALQAAGFRVQVVEAANETAAQGLVIGSVPASGTRQPNGSRVTLTVSSGPACSGSVVPEVVGLQLGQANEALGAVKLSSSAQQVVDGGAAPGTVTSANPAAGQCTDPGTTISLSVSCQSITVPGQENFNVADTRNLGFEVEVRQVDRGDLQPGQLVSVEPAFGTTACPGSRVVVTVNQQCDFATMPNVVGRGVSRANRLIQRESLRPLYVEEFNSDESRGDVIRTEPGADAQVCEESQVTVYVSLGDPPDDDD